MVQNQHLAILAEVLGLEKYMLYAHGSDLCHDTELRHAMANCFEALMGAIYLDGGIDQADRIFAFSLFGAEPDLHETWVNFDFTEEMNFNLYLINLFFKTFFPSNLYRSNLIHIRYKCKNHVVIAIGLKLIQFCKKWRIMKNKLVLNLLIFDSWPGLCPIGLYPYPT